MSSPLPGSKKTSSPGHAGFPTIAAAAGDAPRVHDSASMARVTGTRKARESIDRHSFLPSPGYASGARVLYAAHAPTDSSDGRRLAEELAHALASFWLVCRRCSTTGALLRSEKARGRALPRSNVRAVGQRFREPNAWSPSRKEGVARVDRVVGGMTTPREIRRPGRLPCSSASTMMPPQSSRHGPCPATTHQCTPHDERPDRASRVLHGNRAGR